MTTLTTSPRNSKERLVHLRYPKYIITINYQELGNGMVQYGATFFRKDSVDPVFTKTHRKNSNSTARERFTKNPVVVTLDYDPNNYESLRSALRQAVARYGVHARKVGTTTEV